VILHPNQIVIPPIMMAACGVSSSIALTEGGRVWTCGKGQHAGTYADDDLYHCILTIVRYVLKSSQFQFLSIFSDRDLGMETTLSR